MEIANIRVHLAISDAGNLLLGFESEGKEIFMQMAPEDGIGLAVDILRTSHKARDRKHDL